MIRTEDICHTRKEYHNRSNRAEGKKEIGGEDVSFIASAKVSS